MIITVIQSYGIPDGLMILTRSQVWVVAMIFSCSVIHYLIITGLPAAIHFIMYLSIVPDYGIQIMVTSETLSLRRGSAIGVELRGNQLIL